MKKEVKCRIDVLLAFHGDTNTTNAKVVSQKNHFKPMCIFLSKNSYLSNGFYVMCDIS